MMKLQLFSLSELAPAQAAFCIANFVEALILTNMVYLKENPKTPSLYEAGIKYRAEEPWSDIPALLARGSGDCKSLVAWRIAELRGQGHMALVHVVYTPNRDEETFHVQVRRKTKTEDPSRFLGMRT